MSVSGRYADSIFLFPSILFYLFWFYDKVIAFEKTAARTPQKSYRRHASGLKLGLPVIKKYLNSYKITNQS